MIVTRQRGRLRDAFRSDLKTNWQAACEEFCMSDNKTKTAPHDAERVNAHEDYEVAYWSKRFATTPEELKAAVKKVGVMAEDVEKELKRK